MKKKLALGAALAMLVLTGCGDDAASGTEKADDNGVTQIQETLSDGRTVTCLKYVGYKQGGLSCDWAGAK